MKKFILLFILVATGSCMSFATSRELTIEEALSIAKNEISESSAKYYQILDTDSLNWRLFIDLHPDMMWCHECCVITMPRSIESSGYDLPISTEMRMSPGSLRLRSLDEQTYNEVPDYSQPNDGPVIIPEANPFSSKTYVIILNGGQNQIGNCMAAWNTCSYMYKTLRNKFGIEKSHIYTLMADGQDPGEDMWGDDNNPGSWSQNLDLDGDGECDIMYSAIKENIDSVFHELYNKLKKGDHLFFFGMDHGVSDGSTSYLCLWGPDEQWNQNNELFNIDSINSDYLYSDMELVAHLRPLKAIGVICSGVFGQCRSGGFVTKLNQIGIPSASSCRIDQNARFSKDNRYAEFLYHWINAINEAQPDGRILHSDENNDGIISLKEAFEYAKEHDSFAGTNGSETPQYGSTPEFIGEHLAFNYIPPGKNIYIKDFANDIGIEDNKIKKAWQSPSIICSNLEEYPNSHIDPCGYAPNQEMYVHITVHNQGIEPYPAGSTLRAYWTNAMLGFSASSFDANNSYDGGSETQGIIGSATLPEIAVGDSVTIVMEWNTPRLDNEENQHIGYYALLGGGEVNPALYNVSHSNKSAMRMTCIVPKERVSKWSRIFIHNPATETKSYTLSFPKSEGEQSTIFNIGNVELLLDEGLFNAWSAGGNKGTYNTVPSNPRSVILTSESDNLADIQLAGGQTCELRLKSHFTEVPMLKSWIRRHDLCLKDNEGKLVGGCSFTIYSPTNASIGGPIIVPDTLAGSNSGTLCLTVGNGDYPSAIWTDERGKVLGTSETIAVPEKPIPETYRLMAVNEEGEWGEDAITVISETGIGSIGYIEGGLKIILKNNVTEGDRLQIISVNDGAIIQEVPLQKDIKEINVSIPPYIHGICNVVYFHGDMMWDDQRILIK